ncbi:MAG: hypothetical protein ABW205_11440, partial [Burkholderiales bacterium]
AAAMRAKRGSTEGMLGMAQWYRRAPRNASARTETFSAFASLGYLLMNSVLLATSLGALIAQVDTSVVSLAAKPIGTDLGSAASGMQWMIDA